ncbi:parasitic phase-specific PSP-1 [Fusarium agapanthi]|uniref:Parasitic phase-specific PSP-1 n=1 Tax=Fusarium agapanthi TaxID=1803897 RepID=A0A9P5B1D1_9HYPO|nr:parasitic phase-specific PSP-1 [Fusarium agapanthi]
MNDTGNFVIFGPKANCTLELCPIEMSVYGYRPSLLANITFASLFTLATFVHAYLGFKCYVARILLWVNPWSFGAFITQIIAITQAPVFYCAAIYVTLGQSIEHYGPSLARFPTKDFAWVFVPMDIISLILQGTGGGLSASSSGASQVGVDFAMAGLILQVIMLVAFSLLFGNYMFRYLKSKKSRNLGSRDKLFFAFLAIAVLATLARCVFRTDELKEGYQGELIKHGDLFIALEGVLIVVAVFCLFVAHPGFFFNRPAKVYYSVATGTEATEEMAYRSKLADPVSESEH